jgi:hypothetical protein
MFHRIGLMPTSPPSNPGAAPAVDALVGGRTTRVGGCVEFAPAGAGPAQPEPALELTVPASGLVLTARGGGATVTVRRFADGFPDEALGRISLGGSGLLTIRPDRAPHPWHVRVAPEARVTACGAPS